MAERVANINSSEHQMLSALHIFQLQEKYATDIFTEQSF